MPDYTLIGIRSLITDLKIYFIGPHLNESLIKPWSVVGKYVRRCIIIYEKTPFDKIVTLSKQSSLQFKNLTCLITKHLNLLNLANKKSADNVSVNGDSKTPTYPLLKTPTLSKSCIHNLDPQNYEIDTSNSPTAGTLFVNDESNITLASEWLNRSSHADCSVVMDLEESLTTQSSTAPSTLTTGAGANKFKNNSKFDLKTLTSTVSAQRTHPFKALAASSKLHSEIQIEAQHKSTHPTVTFQLPSQHGDRTFETSIICESNVNDTVANFKFDTYAAEKSNMDGSHITSGFEFSRKIAEYFVAKQAYLIENNEHDALSPVELMGKIDELISYDSSFSEAYYLKYLNYMRLKDYPMALKALHDYFDRLLLAGSVSLAALNLCSLEYRFDNKYD